MPEQPSSRRVTFPLALLFVIVTGAAVIAALIGPILRDIDFGELAEEPAQVLMLLLGMSIAGTILGALLGLFQFNRLLGVAVGAWVGGMIGPVALILMTVPTEKVSSVVPAVCIGSVILLLIAWLVRPPAPPEAEEEIVPATLANERDGQPKG